LGDHRAKIGFGKKGVKEKKKSIRQATTPKVACLMDYVKTSLKRKKRKKCLSDFTESFRMCFLYQGVTLDRGYISKSFSGGF